ncbi:MAG: 2-C-methyl-D-erythritol 4-phosphate cytidylyltransferase, partial [Proteobacteria bacterium]|nr:2-C-methyl-D-erythritol 4-phosphate cytidylyltransferase [Pseudomonadota bacterium]
MDALLAALRAAGEPTRLRLVQLLTRGELTVSELVHILGQSQPRISRHLKLLTEAGLLARHPEGSWVFYRLAKNGPGAEVAGHLTALLAAGEDQVLTRDLERLAEVKRARADAAAAYFRRNAESWDKLRSLHIDDREVEKVIAPLLGKPMIAHAISAFEECPQVREIVLVLSPGNLEQGRSLMALGEWRKLAKVCPGGPRRQDSVKAGLQSLSHCQWVMVHDGARPCVTQELLQRGLEQVLATGAAIPALPMNDTGKKVDSEGIVLETLQREGLRAVQTPQVFSTELLRKAYQEDLDEVTDDASLLEKLGHQVKVFRGSDENIKVTTPEDLIFAEAIL